jgi:hypothetical protein
MMTRCLGISKNMISKDSRKAGRSNVIIYSCFPKIYKLPKADSGAERFSREGDNNDEEDGFRG